MRQTIVSLLLHAATEFAGSAAGAAGSAAWEVTRASLARREPQRQDDEEPWWTQTARRTP